MRKRHKLGTALLSGVLASSMLFSSFGNVQANTTTYTNATGAYDYNSSDPLYAATHFHIFAKDYAEIRAHCHGNVATNVFSAGSNSGSNKMGAAVKSEIFYFRKADASNGFIADFAGATVVLGAETTAQIMNNTEISFSLSDGSYKKIEPNSTVYTEESTTNRFIDFDAEFTKLNNLSTHLVTQNPVTSDTASDTNVTVTPGINYSINLGNQTDTTTYVHIDGNSVTGGGDFKIENIDDFKSGEALVINYEIPAGTTSYTVPFTKILISDKTGQLNSHENWGDYTGHGNILWNFYTTDGSDNVIPYTGTINTCDLFKGTVLAPSATIKMANSNQDGNFIGASVYGGGGETHRWDFGGALPRPTADTDLTPTGAIEVIVTEKGTGTPISSVTIDVSTDSPKSLTTDANGKTETVTNLPLNQNIDITLTTPGGYKQPDNLVESITLTSSATVQVRFELEKDTQDTTTTPTGSLRVYVVDAVTSQPVSGVEITLLDPSNNEVTTFVTGDDGYTTTIATGLTITNDTNVAHTVVTTKVPEGYTIPANETQTILDTALRTVPLYLQKEKTGSIQATIEDEVYSDPISGTEIRIIDEDGKIVQTVTTGADGKTTTVSNLPLNKTYTVEVISVPDGTSPSAHEHPIPAKKTVTLTDTAPDAIVPFVTSPPPHGALQVLVTDRFTQDPINGAVVEIYNADGVLIDTCTTGTSDEGATLATGYTDIIKNLVINNTYTVKVTSVPKGYTAPLDATVTITQAYTSADTITKQELKIHQTGSLQATIVDEKTGAVIPNATGTLTVTQVAQDGTTTTTDIPFTTNSEGKTQIVEDLKIDSTVTIKVNTVPEKYNKPADSTVTIAGTDLTEEILKVAKKTGSLQATIIDETSGDPIPNADIVIKDSEGNEKYSGKTDENGMTAVIPNLPIEETYTIITEAVPDGYTPPANKDVTVTDPSPAVTTVTLTVKQSTEEEKKGSLQATITDKNTGDPIKDATVEITDSTGKVIATSKTDEKGQTTVITGLTINNTYTVHTTTVPDGYTAPDDQKSTISGTGLTTVTLTVEKSTGSLQATITDKNTGNPIADATVEIKDEKGTVIATVKTDEKGITPVVSGLTIGTTYTVHVSSVPSGYTAPDDREQLISSSALVTVNLIVSKTADSNVYTGDDTNVFGLGLLAFISLAGIAILTIKRKEF